MTKPVQLSFLNVVIGVTEKGPVALQIKADDNTVILMYPGRMEITKSSLNRVDGTRTVTVTEFFAGANPSWEYAVAADQNVNS